MKIAMASCIFAVSLSAHAIPVMDVVTVNNNFNYWGETRSWTHDITNDGFSIGDTVNSAALSFEFKDDGDWSYEWAKIVIHLFDFEDGGLFEIDTGGLNLNVGASGVASLNSDGTLNVSITSKGGDFYLGAVTLTADVTAASVSEPATLALFGLGLMGLGFSRKKLSA
tara:strand:- start:6 stop:509 length:504 start_codon:yes stop_codon:yes gene_type:complete